MRIDRLNNNLYGEIFNYKGYLTENILNLYGRSDIMEKNPKFNDPYAISILKFKWVYFLENEGEDLHGRGTGLGFNFDEFKNFQFVKKRVFEFIENRRKELMNTPKIFSIDEVEPITLPENIKTTKVNTIRLLHYTGILEFLLKKYPRMNESNLASFFELITKTPITHKNQNKHFYKNTDDSMYYKDDLDLILSKFNTIAENPKK